MDIWENGKYKNIWIYPKETEEDEQVMMAFINGDYGWLMYLRENGDSGFSSRNPNYKGTEDSNDRMDFMLSNGQLDYYPLSYVLPVEQVIKALDYFEKNHKLPEFITWHDDAFISFAFT